jgi:hypothetical protein
MIDMPPPSGEPVRPPPLRLRWSVLIAGVAILLIGIWLVATRLPAFLTAPDDATPSSTGTPATTGDTRRIQATLYYVSEGGTLLVPTSREVLYGATPAEQARRIVEAQVETPAGLASAIPAGTVVRSVFLTDAREAYVDLGGAVRSGHTGGSLDEALAVYAIVNALTVNMPDIVGVQILIDGQEVDTLAGHMDLRFPLGKALDWIQKGP